MRLARVGPPGRETPVVSSSGGTWHDLRPACPDLGPAFWSSAFCSSVDRDAQIAGLPVVETSGQRFGPPLADIGKIVCIGLNYRDHARETGAELPTEPVLFLKAPYTVVGPDDSVLVPRQSHKTDWEIELAVVIGAPARYLSDVTAAADCIGGYAISHDVSEREFQLERGGQWDKGKNCETFNPLGPWVSTREEVGDPQDLSMRLWVNGELQQDGNTRDMAFGVAYLVHYVSQFMTLLPGDVINTGTPAGVALGRPHPRFLAPGDVVELEIDGLGHQRQVMGAA